MHFSHEFLAAWQQCYLICIPTWLPHSLDTLPMYPYQLHLLQLTAAPTSPPTINSMTFLFLQSTSNTSKIVSCLLNWVLAILQCFNIYSSFLELIFSMARFPNYLQIFFLTEVQLNRFSKMLCQLILDLLTQLLMQEVVSLSLQTNELTAVTNMQTFRYVPQFSWKWYFTGSKISWEHQNQLAIHRNV